jgi:hypothetical protein
MQASSLPQNQKGQTKGSDPFVCPFSIDEEDGMLVLRQWRGSADNHLQRPKIKGCPVDVPQSRKRRWLSRDNI